MQLVIDASNRDLERIVQNLLAKAITGNEPGDRCAYEVESDV